MSGLDGLRGVVFVNYYDSIGLLCVLSTSVPLSLLNLGSILTPNIG